MPESSDAAPTVASLRPPAGSDEVPVHRRTIDIEVFVRKEYLLVVGTLADVRPWASGELGPRELHRMELAIVVRRADMTITDAVAEMKTFPHAECTVIEPKFSELIGLSVARGYTAAVQERFGRERGCSHLEFLARAIGPAVVQSMTSAAAEQFEKSGVYPDGGRSLSFLSNTCHVFIEDGPGSQKIEAGWRPGMFGLYPAPTVTEIRRRIAEGDSGNH
ncbi:MAG TPA: DUF2889 domain-containing protein [Acidimicrobiales bacterium]|nr:DUF2889 domain-containing protein [Acidimicrobiales bacterium]